MKKKILLILTIGLSIAITLSGCTSSEESPTLEESCEKNTVSMQETTFYDDISGEEDETGEMMEVYVLTASVDSDNYCNIEVLAYDESGMSVRRVTPLLHLPLVMTTREYGYLIFPDEPRFGNYQDRFTPDFSKIAVTRVQTNGGVVHAGWVNMAGEFFDVTEALGEPSADELETQIEYRAVGFTDNGETFVYEKISKLEDYWIDGSGYYAVSVGDIRSGTSWKMSPSTPYLHADESWAWLGDYKPNDWLDDTHFYASNSTNDSYVIVDTETRDISEIPLNYEHFEIWSVIPSPDGQEVARMSKFKLAQTERSVEVDITNRKEGGYSRTVGRLSGCCSNDFSDINHSRSEGIYCTILDWK